ncbi:MAG: hypothetical protein BWY02_01233 [bacterium ADurb.Bin157]|jgi:hypothetical protein|nr:hypothetical protein [Candidatus Riflebacteria bacterium]MDD3378152.1 hypothetical protein [Candidatus Riflebacteria bacterium]NCB45399.1 hypothetical protein [bacterium]NLV94887.1 hypothetical protein [Candidatus Riflebacteria bacterium]OQB49645.1 MAG: hypothetical protein BWY02_01233 [bacterium ADurb.Bin157]
MKRKLYLSIAALFFIAVLVFFIPCSGGQAYAITGEKVLELIITTDKGDGYTYYAELSDRDFRKLKNDLMNEIKPYLIDARKECAREMGYREEIYGEENYKMVIITKYSIVIRDQSNGRTILSR